jgi:hypothetical protein
MFVQIIQSVIWVQTLASLSEGHLDALQNDVMDFSSLFERCLSKGFMNRRGQID